MTKIIVLDIVKNLSTQIMISQKYFNANCQLFWLSSNLQFSSSFPSSVYHMQSSISFEYKYCLFEVGGGRKNETFGRIEDAVIYGKFAMRQKITHQENKNEQRPWETKCYKCERGKIRLEKVRSIFRISKPNVTEKDSQTW